jgi:hypothetical protein
MEQKQPNYFVISLSGSNIDLSIINIEEMTGYCKNRNRFANVVTQKQTYDEVDRLNYSLIGNYTRPKPRVVNTKDNQYLGVYNFLSEKYRSGLLIAEKDTISDPISEHLCNNENWKKNDIDIMICRDFATMTKEEIKRANFLRISADPDFNPVILQEIDDVFKEKVIGLMIAQFFVNENYDAVNRYIEQKSVQYASEGITEFIDYYELNKQLAYFIYYDIAAGKIMNVDKAIIMAFIKKLSGDGLLPIPSEQIEPIADIITL